MRFQFILVVALWFVGRTSGFTPVPMQVAGWFENLLGDKKVEPPSSQTEELKTLLLQQCRRTDPPPTRQEIQEIIDQLAPLSPVTATAASPLLQAKWILEWTTEKEINFFIQQGFSEKRAIYQTIEGDVLGNMIPFTRGGGFGVTGSLEVLDKKGQRTNFVFSKAKLDLGRWGKYDLPPIGKGWFDTIFLDQDLRVDVNSRNDILICTPAAAE